MTRKLAAILAIIAVSGIVAHAATISPSLSTSLFNSTPISVFNVATADDSAFVDRPYTGVHFVAGTDNETIYVYSVKYVDASTDITVVRRSLNATSVAAGVANLTTGATDATITASKSDNAPSFYADGLGYFAFLTDVEDGSSIVKLYLNILSGTATSPASIEFTGNAEAAATPTPLALWWEDDSFYVVYTITGSTSDDGIYLQGIKGSDGSKLYTAPSKVVSLATGDTVTTLTAGSTNYTNSTLIAISYKIDDKVYVAQATRSTGAISGTVATLYTDVPRAAGTTNGLTYLPAGVFGSGSTYGVGVSVQEELEDASEDWTSIVVFYNGTTSNPTNISVNLTVPTNYVPSGLGGFNFVEGYALLYVSNDDGTNEPSYALQTYFPNGTANGTQLTVGTAPTVSIFADANGTVWFGTASYDDAATKYAVQGYLGKLLGQIYASGNIIASFFALLSLLIAALFAF